ncbi:aspartokinase-like uncharacterized kinase [Methanohalophilus levihalophilus]|uniref:amino acid kinase family protein n=1 Tax=Methanohalophilus levihalophilus TaxID=1431282 RepID=UPI001AE61A40|nr:amino acid kinase [Methanohalophilus levihalophilus]MBP2030955.1 aspartokinase-like uncharacterized kinase [Methanohalophilus levihalophilus]
MSKKAVIKIGGSLIKEAAQLIEHIADNRNSFGKQIVFIPGGGIFANFIREADNRFNLDLDSSHWMAILAMEQYGYYLAGKTGIPTITALEDNKHQIAIFLPYSLLVENDPLPHSWDITSDTIAAFFAEMEKAEFIKVTDVDGVLVHQQIVEEIDTTRLASMGETCADLAFPGFLEKHKLDCFVLNGKIPDRLLEYIQEKKTIGTLIKGNI